MAEFVMPSLGADMEAGTLVAWRKQPGDSVARGDIIAEVDTDKGVIEVEVYNTGIIEKLLIAEGTKVPVGTPLAVIREPGDTQGPSTASPQRASPAAKKLAEEHGIDLATIRGTGPGGAVTREDVAKQLPAEPETDAKTRMRRAIAAAMERSNREIPHYYLCHSFDVSAAREFLAQKNAELPVDQRLIFGVLLLKAVALALRKFPELNARWQDNRVTEIADIHVGMAVSLRDGGLVIPALHHTDRLDLAALMSAFGDLVSRTRSGDLKSSELSDGTITVTSLGDRGVDQVFGVIYPPQVALVGFGKVATRPWANDEQIVARPVLTASLAADHRASDAHRGSLFLSEIERLLAHPEELS